MLIGRIDQVVEGMADFHMQPGDTITVPRNLRHLAVNTGTAPAEMLVVFSSPERQTILK